MCATIATGYPREHKTLFDIPLLLSMYVESLLKKIMLTSSVRPIPITLYY